MLSGATQLAVHAGGCGASINRVIADGSPRITRRSTEFVADDWATLQELLYRDSWNEELGRHRSSYGFREMADNGNGLETSLQRFVGESD